MTTLYQNIGAFYYGSYISTDDMPNRDVEIVFIGRSNVGKSSLINALTRSSVCHISKTPGKTKMINMIGCSKPFSFIVDLPGYGYSKCSADLRNTWKEVMPLYLANSHTIKMVYLLLDAKVRICDADIAMIKMLSKLALPWSAVLTKIEKMPKNLSYIMSNKEFKHDIMHFTSTKQNVGIEKLRREVVSLLSNV